MAKIVRCSIASEILRRISYRRGIGVGAKGVAGSDAIVAQ